MSEGIVIALIGGVFTLVGSLLPHYLQNRQRAPQPSSSPAAAPIPSTSSPVTQTIQIGKVIRDVGIIWILTGLAGFLVGLSAGNADSNQTLNAIAIANLVFGTVGFVISGTRAPANRWKHLIAVAVVLWLSSIINVFVVGVDISLWFLSIFSIMVMMVLGGLISYIFNR